MRLLASTALLAACASCVAGGGEGGGPSDAAPAVFVQDLGDGNLRLVITDHPMECDAEFVPDVIGQCEGFVVEATLPASRLHVGTLTQDDDVEVRVLSAFESEGNRCKTLAADGSGSGTVSIDSLTADGIRVTIADFESDLDVDGDVDTSINGVYSGVRCKGVVDAPWTPELSVITQSVDGNRVRIVVDSDPIDCSFSEDTFDATVHCSRFTVEAVLPRELLQVGPLLPSAGVFIQRALATPEFCFDSGIAAPSETLVIEALTDDSIEVRLSGFRSDLDLDDKPDLMVNGVHSGVRCDTALDP